MHKLWNFEWRSVPRNQKKSFYVHVVTKLSGTAPVGTYIYSSLALSRKLHKMSSNDKPVPISSSTEAADLCSKPNCEFYKNSHLGEGEFCSDHYFQENNLPRLILDPRLNFVPICTYVRSGQGMSAECIPHGATTIREEFRNGPAETHLGYYPCVACWERWQRSQNSSDTRTSWCRLIQRCVPVFQQFKWLNCSKYLWLSVAFLLYIMAMKCWKYVVCRALQKTSQSPRLRVKIVIREQVFFLRGSFVTTVPYLI